VPRFEIQWLAAAEAELDAAYHYLKERSPGAADDFVLRIEEAVADLEETAHTWDAANPDERRYRLQQFPYALIYRLYGDVVVIGVVMHLRRHPGYWKDRRF